MKIHGLQKLTLLDYPGRVACTIFTAGCNFRCPFCHNAGLVTHIEEKQKIAKEEVLSFLKQRIGILDGVCVTGGEPLLQPDIQNFLCKIKEMGYDIKLDTNGSFPELLRELVEEKLVDYVAMDIKNTCQKYGETIGVPNYNTELIERSVEYLKEEHIPYEFRTTVVREFHQKNDFTEMAKWLLGDERYYLQSFVDLGDLIQDNLHGYDEFIMRQILENVQKYLPNAEIRGIE